MGEKPLLSLVNIFSFFLPKMRVFYSLMPATLYARNSTDRKKPMSLASILGAIVRLIQ